MRKFKTDGLEGSRLALVTAANNRGMNLKELSLALGKNHSYLYQHVRRNTPATLDFEDLLKLGELLGVNPDQLSDTKTVSDMVKVVPTFLRVAGTVQAGVWHESDTSGDFDAVILPVAPHPEYSGANQFLLHVAGPSMNLRIPENSYVHCVAIEYQDEITPQNGDVVVVERRRAGLIESTLKEYVVTGEGAQLWPRSTDPRYQEPVELHDGKHTDAVQITAIVLNQITPMRSRK